MKKQIFTLLMAAAMAFVPVSASAAGDSTKGGLTVSQQNFYNFPDSSSGYLFAKIENTGKEPAAFDHGELEVFSDSEELLVSDDYVMSWPPDVLVDPGEYIYVSSFLYESALEGATAGEIKFSAEVSSDGTAAERISAEASFEKKGPDSYNNYVLVTVTNETDEVQYGYYVTVALSDKEGNLMFADSDHYGNFGVHPGSTVTLRFPIDNDLMEYYNKHEMSPAAAEAIVYLDVD